MREESGKQRHLPGRMSWETTHAKIQSWEGYGLLWGERENSKTHPRMNPAWFSLSTPVITQETSKLEREPRVYLHVTCHSHFSCRLGDSASPKLQGQGDPWSPDPSREELSQPSWPEEESPALSRDLSCPSPLPSWLLPEWSPARGLPWGWGEGRGRRPKCRPSSVVVLCVQSCLTLYDPMDYSLPGSSVHAISQARILEWVAISSSMVFSPLRDQTHVSLIVGQIFHHWAI